jgi:serine/threonine-protein kinase
VGNHRVIAPLAVGRDTDVLLAVSHGPHGFARPVVLKRLRSGSTKEPAHLRALAREAMAYARLNHPSIVRLYDFSEHDGECVIVLEYVNGMTLRDLVGHLRVRGQTMTEDVAFYVMANVFAALSAAHTARDPATGEFASVIHRDVSPKNVLIDWDGAVKLADFGIAKLAGVTSDTRAGLLKGTYGYMAPEQVLGEPTTVRTDVYAACLVFRELLLGKRAFTRGEMPELEFLKVMAEPKLEPIEDLRPDISPLVARALRVGLEPMTDRRDIACAEIRDVLMGAVNMEKARHELAVLLHELRPTQDSPRLFEAEATERQPSDPALALPEPKISGRPSGIHFRGPDARATHPEMVSSIPPSSPREPLPTTPDLPVIPTKPSAFRVAQRMKWHVMPEKLRHPSPRAALIAGITVPVLLTLVVLLASRTQRVAEAAVFSATAAMVAVEPDEVRSAAAAPTEDTPSNAAPPTHGTIITDTASHDHRIYVDGQVAGESGEPIDVRCGRHIVRYGSKGRPQVIDVPCGGEYVLSPRW